MQRRVLIISYYFPPSGGSGVQRSLKFVKYLRTFGWEPVVLTVDPEYAAYPDLDEAMAAVVPESVACFRTKSWDPYRLFGRLKGQKKSDTVSVGFLSERPPSALDKVARWVRANLFLPDARVGWNRYAKKEASFLIEEGDIDAVFTTGPPHSTHLIGQALHRQYGMPWVADFRDPWMEIDFIEKLPMIKQVRLLNQRMEQSVMDDADRLITISPSMQRAFQKKTRTPCISILNGFDEEDFEAAKHLEEDAFVISHIGNMNADRNPVALWDVLERCIRNGKLSRLKIRLVGNVDQSIFLKLEQAGLTSIVEKIAYLPHREAVSQAMASAVLLLPINNVPSAKGIVTGKLFEYLATQNPILGIGPPEGEAGRILAETGAGKMIDYTDEARMEAFITEAYRAWETGKSFMAAKPETIEQYSRKFQTGILAGVLNELVNG